MFNQQFSADFVADAFGKHAIYARLRAYALSYNVEMMDEIALPRKR
jgi:hypothetical protein